MRSISLLIAIPALASCTAEAQAPTLDRSPSGQRAYENILAGKVPGPPINCLPSYNTNDTSIIDGHTLGFRIGTETTYIVHLGPGCELLGSGPYALLTRQIGSSEMCRGDIQQVLDTMNHMTVGSCTISEIIPYTKR